MCNPHASIICTRDFKHKGIKVYLKIAFRTMDSLHDGENTIILVVL
jgi:hypothetical protein